MENMLFKTIPIKEEDIEAVKILAEFLENDAALLDQIGNRLRIHRKALFGGIDKLYPELAGYEYAYNHEKNLIRIIGVKKSKFI